jgi:hypothetical protein
MFPTAIREFIFKELISHFINSWLTDSSTVTYYILNHVINASVMMSRFSSLFYYTTFVLSMHLYHRNVWYRKEQFVFKIKLLCNGASFI